MRKVLMMAFVVLVTAGAFVLATGPPDMQGGPSPPKNVVSQNPVELYFGNGTDLICTTRSIALLMLNRPGTNTGPIIWRTRDYGQDNNAWLALKFVRDTNSNTG